MEHVRIEREDGIAIVTIDRIRRRNAFHRELWDEVRQVGEALERDPPRAVILTGEGGHFCAGMDLSPDNTLLMEVGQGVAGRDAGVLTGIINRLKQTNHVWTRIGCPVVAAIEGACVGQGLELALSADLRVASCTVKIGLPEATLGMVPDVGGTVRLTRLVGPARATRLTLTGELIDGKTALSWGLVDEVCEPGQSLQTARDLVGRFKARPVAGSETLKLIRSVPELGDRAFDEETAAGVRALLSGEVLQALMERGQQ